MIFEEELKKVIGEVVEIDKKILEKYIDRFNELDKELLSGPFIHYVFNLSTLKYEYISPSVENIVGSQKVDYGPGKTGMVLTDNMFKEDLEIVSKRILPKFAAVRRKVVEDDEENNLSFQMSYRIKKENGKVSRLLDNYSYLPSHEKKFSNLIVGKITEIKFNTEAKYVSSSVFMHCGEGYKCIMSETFSELDSKITDREKQVLKLLADGKTSNDIAVELHISKNTVNRHRQNIFDKLQLESPKELTKHAILNGLIN